MGLRLSLDAWKASDGARIFDHFRAPRLMGLMLATCVAAGYVAGRFRVGFESLAPSFSCETSNSAALSNVISSHVSVAVCLEVIARHVLEDGVAQTISVRRT